jgi:hypothetical protein
MSLKQDSCRLCESEDLNKHFSEGCSGIARFLQPICKKLPDQVYLTFLQGGHCEKARNILLRQTKLNFHF